MKYLKIIAENYNEAMRKLRVEHGDEAIPISHKYVKQGGFFNSKFFAKDMVELTAAVKEQKKFQPQSIKKSTIDFIVDDKTETPRLNNAHVQDIVNRTLAPPNSASSKEEFNASSKEEFNVDSIKKIYR